MSSTIHVYCDLCGVEVNKTEQTKGFGAVSIISLEYKFKGLKIADKGLVQKNFDVCFECSEKLSKYIEEEKKANKKVEVEEIKT